MPTCTNVRLSPVRPGRGLAMASERIVPVTRTPLTDKSAVMLVHATLWYLDIPTTATNVLVPVLGMEHGAGADTSAPADGRLVWACYNYNYGNRRGPQGDDGRYVMTAGEIIKGKEVPLSGGWPAFTSRHMGMVSWIQLWQRRYATALDRAVSGDIEGTCRAMKLG